MNINPFKLERFFAKYEFTTPYLLCSSDCESISIGELLYMEKGASEDFKKVWLGYTESQGDPELRELIAGLYTNQNPEDIIVFSGAEEGIFIFMNVLLNQGDNIIVQTPCYQSLFEVASSVGASISEWIMDADNDWQLNIDQLQELIKPNTKAIIINSPNNPTGYCIPPDNYKRIIEIAEKNDIIIFSDEVYKYAEYDKKDRLPSMCDMYKNGI
ncbi:aminotransferase class I/II-fold pyridoxal phosphate-dependent enzyme, partial [Bacteroidota bacterium]